MVNFVKTPLLLVVLLSLLTILELLLLGVVVEVELDNVLKVPPNEADANAIGALTILFIVSIKLYNPLKNGFCLSNSIFQYFLLLGSTDNLSIASLIDLFLDVRLENNVSTLLKSPVILLIDLLIILVK